MNQSNQTISAREAAELLGVKLATLYAYVSRGLLSSSPGERGRERRYPRADVESLRSRRRAAAAGALRWGEPVLDTSISAMTPQGPRYRGRLATELAEAGTPFESVAELLWRGELPEERPLWPLPPPLDVDQLSSLVPRGAPLSGWSQVLVAVLGAADPGRFDTRPEAVLPRARGLIRALAAASALPFDPVRAEAASAEATVAGSVAVALGVPPRPGALAAIDRALVLLADHELNASTFAARVVASTRADVYAAVLAGLSTLSGPLHGAASDRVEALLAEIPSPEDAASVIHERDRMGERVPGFGHPYYPDGDPRAPLLIDAAFEVGLREPMLRRLGALADAMEAAGRPPPNVDVGIVALSAALRMPRGAASGLFAVARCAGWVAHVLEQYQAGFLMRPRARYTPADGEGSPSEGESP